MRRRGSLRTNPRARRLSAHPLRWGGPDRDGGKRRARLRRILAMVLLAALLSVPAVTADERRPLPVAVTPAAGATLSGEEERFLTDVLLAELSGNDGGLAILRVDDETYRAEARDRGIPGLLVARIGREDDRYTVTLQYLRAHDGAVLLEKSGDDSVANVSRNPARLFEPLVGEVRSFLQDHLAPERSASEPDPYRAALTLRGGAGMRLEVRGAGASIVTVIDESEEWTFDLLAPAYYTISVTSPRHFPEVTAVLLPLEGSQVEVMPPPHRRTFVDLFLLDASAPGASLGVRLDPLRRNYLTVGVHTYLLTMVPMLNRESDGEEYGFFFSTPLSVVDLQVGRLLRKRTRSFRPYVAGGLFGRVVHSRRLVGFDPIGPGGVTATLGAEIDAGRRVALFAETTPRIYATENIANLERYYPMGAVSFPFVAGTDGLVTFRHFRIGVRTQL